MALEVNQIMHVSHALTHNTYRLRFSLWQLYVMDEFRAFGHLIEMKNPWTHYTASDIPNSTLEVSHTKKSPKEKVRVPSLE